MSAPVQRVMRQVGLVGFAFDLLFVMLAILWVLGTSGIWFDLTALGFLCMWATYEALCSTRSFFLNIHSYLFGFIFLLGVFAIEYSSGFYMYEIDEFSGWANTFFGALACVYAYLRGVCVALSFKAPVEQVRGGRIYGFYFVVVSYLLLSFAVIFYFKPALVLQVDRFFYDKSVLGFWGNVTNLGYYFCLGLGIAFFCARSKFAFLLFVLVMFVFLLKGHKFGNLIDAVFLFVLPYFCVAAVSVLRKKFFVIFSGIGFFLFVAVGINLYLFPSFSPEEYLKTRLSQEGQLWWGVARNEEYRQLHLEEWGGEFATYFSDELMEENFYNIGMYKVMRLTAPHGVVEKKIENFSRYARSTQALLLYYFNLFFVFVFMALFGGVWGWLLRRMYLSVVNFRLVESILLCRLFYIFMKAFKDGDLYKIFSLEMLVIIVLLMILERIKVRFPRVKLQIREACE